MFLSCSYGYQIIFFLLSLFIVIKNFILVNNEKEEDEIENKNKEEFLKLNKRIEEVERKNNILNYNNNQIIKDNEDLLEKNNILIKDNKDLLEKVKEVKKDNQILFFEHKFMVNYQNDINEKFKLNRKNDKLRVNYLLLSFSSKVKNIIAITRIVNFRKIVNCLLNHIIEKNKIYLKKTSAKFYDILKPKDNQRAFFIIYCTENKVNDVTKKAFNIIIDFLMFIHNYTSSILHLNKIENYQDIIPNIENNKNGENSPKSDSNISENKTNYSFHLNDLVDYVFNSYNIEKETKEMIKKIENEEKQNIENSKNINIVSKKNGDNSNNINSEFIEYNKNAKSFGESEKNEEIGEINTQLNVDDIKQEGKNNNIININNNNDDKNNINIYNNKADVNNENGSEKKENSFENFKLLFNNDLLKEQDFIIIKKIFSSMNSQKINVNTLIRLYNDNIKEINDIENTIEMYNDKINNYKFEYAEEFTIEKMISIYKSNFDKNSTIYAGFNKNKINEHYRFNSSYNKIIESDDVNKFNFNEIKHYIKKLSGNTLIDLLSEDQGRFGQELPIEDLV